MSQGNDNVVEVTYKVSDGNNEVYFDAHARWSRLPYADAVLLQTEAVIPSFNAMATSGGQLGKKKAGLA